MSVDAQTHTDPEIEEVSTWISHTCYEPHLEDCDSDNGSDSGDEESDTLGAVVLDLGTLWNVGETVNYCFLAGKHQGTAVQHKKVAQVAQEWGKYANIHFQEVDDQKAIIRITFDPRSGAWAAPGNTAKDIKVGKATMNLGPVTAATDEPTPLETGYILHEFGHVIGFGHEHQSPFMEGELKTAAITRYYQQSLGMPEKWVQKNITNTYKQETISSYSAFDSKSIMIYPMPPQMFTEGALKRHASLLDQEQERSIINSCLSEVDIAFAIINYPRPEPHPDWTYEKALRVAGVEEKWALELLKFWEQNNYTELRMRFSLWNKEKQNTLTEELRVEISVEMEEFEEKERERIAALTDPKEQKKEEFKLKERKAEHKAWFGKSMISKLSSAREKAVSLATSAADTLFGRSQPSK